MVKRIVEKTLTWIEKAKTENKKKKTEGVVEATDEQLINAFANALEDTHEENRKAIKAMKKQNK